jgi:hypothetical protein
LPPHATRLLYRLLSEPRFNLILKRCVVIDLELSDEASEHCVNSALFYLHDGPSRLARIVVYLYEVADLDHRREITYKAETKPALGVPMIRNVKR